MSHSVENYCRIIDCRRSNEPISDEDFMEMFDEFDADHNGLLTWDELKTGLVARGLPMSTIRVCRFIIISSLYRILRLGGSREQWSRLGGVLFSL